MAIINVLGKRVDVDVEAEMREFVWERDRWSPDKLIACSPFREDRHPSFYINFETGGWADSGSIGENATGNIFTLIGQLHGITYQEACEYLIDKYGALYDITSTTEEINFEAPKLRPEVGGVKEINGDHLTQAISPYMSKRGISDEVQVRFGIGYGSGQKGFTAIPWYSVEGYLSNVKYRATKGKKFFYESDGALINTLVYGMSVAKEHNNVVVVEGEVDALSWWTAGIPAVAIGSADIGEVQMQILVRGGFDKIYLAGDNDRQGRELNRMLKEGLGGVAELFEVSYGKENDANDILMKYGVEAFDELIKESKRINTITLDL